MIAATVSAASRFSQPAVPDFQAIITGKDGSITIEEIEAYIRRAP
jgi:hypothetical protein